MMKDNKIILPSKVFNEIKELDSLSVHGWTVEWQNKAKSIINQLILLRDKNEITQEEFDYIHRTYLKSIGIISESNSDFFNFILNRN